MIALGRRLFGNRAPSAPRAPKPPLTLRLVRGLAALRQRWQVLLLVPCMLLLAFVLAGMTALQPFFIIMLLAAVVALGGLVWLLRSLAPGAPWWIKGSFFVVFGQLTLSYGFSNILFPLGGLPLPLTDLVMIIALMYCAVQVFWAEEKVQLPTGLWLLALWIVFNLGWHLPSGMLKYGVPAARDAMPTVQMAYVLPGFVIGILCLRNAEVGGKWLRGQLPLLAWVVALYGLTWPFERSMLSISPRWPSLQQTVPIFGYHTTWPAMGIISMLGLGFWRWQRRASAEHSSSGFWANALAVVLVASGLMTVLLLQSRASYVFIALSLPLLLLVGGQGRVVLTYLGALLLAVAALTAVELSGLQLQGRIGKLSLSGVAEHVETLMGDRNANSEYGGSAAGLDQRKAWRDYSLGLWSQNTRTQVLGIGFGQVLTDLTTAGTHGETMVVREPHNSFVSTLTRSGVLGLTVMIGLHGSVLACCFFGYRRYRRSERKFAAYFLTVFFFEVYCLLNAWGQPHFEVAHFAVPCYFIYGTVFALRAYLSSRDADSHNRLPAISQR